MKTLLLDRDTVRSLLRWPDVIDAVGAAYRQAAAGAVLPPSAGEVRYPEGSVHLKAGGTADPTLVSVKANLRPDSAPASGLILLFDGGSSELRAVVDSADITAYRTAAAAAVAARAWGLRPGAGLAVLGAGPVGAAVLTAFRQELAVGEVHAWSRDPGRAAMLGADRVHRSPGDAARAADVVVTCTPSRTPLISSADLREDALVCAMGADSPGKRELAADVLQGAEIVTDNPVAAREVGELSYLPPGQGEPVAAVGELLAAADSRGDDGGRRRRRVFDSVGVAHADTAVAALITTAAEQTGLGTLWARS